MAAMSFYLSVDIKVSWKIFLHFLRAPFSYWFCSSFFSPKLDIFLRCLMVLNYPIMLSVKYWKADGISLVVQWLRLYPSNAGVSGSIPSWGTKIPYIRKIPWRRAWQPTPISCLENPLDRVTWQVTVHRVMQSQTWLKRLSTHSHHSGEKLLKEYLD